MSGNVVDAGQRGPFCDVVMKGGITSGVVYPLAVVELAKSFRLKSIGGTSAGAIAAAAAAAAELGERNAAQNGGYQRLAGLPKFLGEENAPGKTNLFSFFQPQPRTRTLYAVLTSGLEAKSAFARFARIWLAMSLQYAPWPIIGLLIGLAFFKADSSWVLGLGWLLVWIVIGNIAMFGWFIRSFGKAVPGSEGGNNFGLCTGMSGKPADDAATGPSVGGQALTVWLTKYLNELAGLDPDGPPLTFGQLWNPNVPAGGPVDPNAEREINLQMFSTSLTEGRPFRLPFENTEDVRENEFYFREEDLKKLFPANVVTWMATHQRDGLPDGKPKRPHRKVPEDILRMPDPWNLPVVVATRMSLSFPILLSAVRLWGFQPVLAVPSSPAEKTAGRNLSPRMAADMAQAAKEDPKPAPCWFSDGGLCSNFPIHLFDSPLPGWPTLGINLVDAPQDATDAQLLEPIMPKTNNDGIQEPWTILDEGGGLGSLFNFLSTLINTMQNWSDNTLSRMPGYRDRIAQVRLRPTEGGLNLSMPPDRITALTARGDAAAKEFARRFSDGTVDRHRMNWANHRWLRFRSLMAAVEEMLASMDDTCADPPQPGDAGYEQWVEQLKLNHAPSYQWVTEDQRALGIESIKLLRELAEKWKQAEITAAEGAPRPRPELRPRPQI